MSDADNAFNEVPGIEPEDAEDLATSAHAAHVKFNTSDKDDYSLLYGLQALGAPPDAVAAAINLGAQFVQQGYLDRAWEFFSGLIKLEPLNWEVLLWLGYIEHLRKHFWGALEFFNLALAYADEEPLVRFYLGECTLMLDRPDIAVVHLQAGIDFAQGNPKMVPFVKRAEQLIVAAKERMSAQPLEEKPNGK